MKLLIAIKSCQRDAKNGSHDAVRDTWGKYVQGADLKFFLGGREQIRLQPNEIQLNAPDDYMSLPHKVREILKWSIGENYNYTYLCDNDTFLIPERLMALPFGTFDYLGDINLERNYASGGIGYLVSRGAAETAIWRRIETWAEDLYVGEACHEQKYRLKIFNAKNMGQYVAWHFPKYVYPIAPTYTPKFPWQRMMAARYLGEPSVGMEVQGPDAEEKEMVLERVW